jgi:hypothetical protein
MIEKMKIFDKIDNIAHEEIQESEEEWNPFSEEGKKIFYELNKEFHNEKNLTEKCRTSKKIVDFLNEQEKYHPNMGEENTDPERDEEFRELLREFITIE